MADSVANRVRIVNNTTVPKTVPHHEHLCQERHTTLLQSDPTHHLPTNVEYRHPSLVFFSDAIKVYPDNILLEIIRNQFCEVLLAHNDLYTLHCYSIQWRCRPRQSCG